MPRGSGEGSAGSGGNSGGGGGGGGGGGEAPPDVEILQQAGQIENSGRYTLRKSYVTQNASTLTQVPSPPPGFRAAGLSWQALGGGAYQKDVEYVSFINQGGAGGGAGGGHTSTVLENRNGVAGRFELDVQDELKPIELHPNILAIVEEYNGYTDLATRKVVFPEKYRPGGGGGLSGGSGEIKNPMFGKTHYSKPAAIFRHIQQTEQIPEDIWANVGKKIDILPAGFPNPPPYSLPGGATVNYYWIVLSPQIYRQGNSYEIVRSYKLSDPNEPDEVYASGQASTPPPTGGV